MTAARLGLQAMIDATPVGETLVLAAGEYEGPVTLHRPLVLEGAKSTIWSQRGPVMRVAGRGTRLRGLRIEVTHFDDDVTNKPEHVALLVERGADVALEEVVVRGYVLGIEGENGAWLMPPSIDLGVFAPRATNTFVLSLFVPVTCQITSEVAGLTVTPTAMMPGGNEITITAADIYPDTLLLGRCYVRSAHVMRPIDVCGRAASDSRTPPVDRQLLWEPSRMPARSEEAKSDEGVPMTEQWLEDEINRLIRAGMG